MQRDDEIRIGDPVLYEGAWGATPNATGTITGIGEKNGKTVYDVRLADGTEHWGYRDQFEPRKSRL